MNIHAIICFHLSLVSEIQELFIFMVIYIYETV